MKKIFILSSVLVGVTLGRGVVMADTTSPAPNQERANMVLSDFKDSDGILKLSTNVYIHGKVSISDLSCNSKGPVAFDSESDPRAKTVKEVKEGGVLEVV